MGSKRVKYIFLSCTDCCFLTGTGLAACTHSNGKPNAYIDYVHLAEMPGCYYLTPDWCPLRAQIQETLFDT